jgi:hypothetical protein
MMISQDNEDKIPSRHALKAFIYNAGTVTASGTGEAHGSLNGAARRGRYLVSLPLPSSPCHLARDALFTRLS